MSGASEIKVRVASIIAATPAIKHFRFERMDGRPLPPFSGGAHIVVSMNDAGHMRRNAYSLTSSPDDTSGYEISVLRTTDSRGGSRFMHETLREGDALTIGYPVNLFQPDWRGRKHILVAGGIGITPFIAMMKQFDRDGIAFELHYVMRTGETGAHWRELLEDYGSHRIKPYFRNEGMALNLDAVLANQPLGTHLYVCGPSAMIDSVLAAGLDAGWPPQSLHSERFLSVLSGKPFLVELTRSGLTVEVGGHDSILETVEAAGVDAPYLCRGGACGQCETSVTGCDGEILHHDVYLSEEEKASKGKIMICVSRFDGRKLQLDL